ncbi:MAG: DUF2306 domain-containing protein [Vicinamibacterales bacterium]
MVNLEPLLRAPLAVQLHVVTVVPAFVLGTWLLVASPKGSSRHRLVGRLYLGLMGVTAAAALCIRSFSDASLAVGPLRLGWIHLFVPLTMHGIYGALVTIRAGDVRGHRSAMRGLYFGGLIVAGLLAFTPGRVMHRMFFG